MEFDFLSAMKKIPRPTEVVTQAELSSMDLDFSLDRRTLDPCRQILWDADVTFRSLFKIFDGDFLHISFECRTKKNLAKLRSEVDNPELFDWYITGMNALSAEWKSRLTKYQNETSKGYQCLSRKNQLPRKQKLKKL